jgi:hypothetical protein
VEIAGVLRDLEAAGLDNVAFPVPPHLTREVVTDIEQRIMPLLAGATAQSG